MAAESIAVLGAGAWGTALANAAAHGGRSVILWARDHQHAADMARQRSNERRLPGVKLAETVAPMADIAAIREASAIILAVPAQETEAIGRLIAQSLPANCPIIITAKGILQSSGAFPRAVIASVLPGRALAILSGPSFAVDVAAGMPTAVVLASDDDALARRLAAMLSSPALRCYHSDDPIGVEIGGAAKNVLAIAAGIVAGRKLGESARAALIARGFAEIQRFARACGARAETLMGLSGLGDLVLTATSMRSRNYSFGVALGAGVAIETAAGGKLVEGSHTAETLVRLARDRNVDMPIAAAVADVVSGRTGIDAALAALMARPLRSEI